MSIGSLFVGTTKNAFDLCKQFALLSFCCILIIGTVSTMMMSKLVTEKILLRDATLSMEFVTSVIAAEGTWQLFCRTKDDDGQSPEVSHHWALESFFAHVALMPDVLRANVYGKDRSVLWSSAPELVGVHFDNNNELDTSLKGELTYDSGVVGSEDKQEHIDFDENMRGLRFIETYIPVWNQDHSEVVGAVELYRVPRMLHQSIIEGQRLIWIGALTGGLLLFISLYWIVKRASRVMESQQQRLLEAKSFSVIGQTASAITHAMRNPLSSIRACAELSLTDDLEGVRESALDIMGETDRLDRWARELLHFSVTNNDSPENLDVNQLIETVLKEHEPALRRTATTLHLDLTEKPLPLAANFTPLSQVFGNLIMNAIEAMGQHGELTISTAIDSHRRQIVTSFSDNGPGISEEIKDKLFQPFATTKSTGTGLGLALSRHLVEHYNGRLEVSTMPGQGVTVTVYLPLSGGLS